MLSKKLFLYVFAASLLATPVVLPNLSVQAQTNQVRLDDVTIDAVTGEGMSAAAAQADAFRNAISQAVGVYVQADTLVEDYVTKSDKIRTSSKGFIKSFQKISFRKNIFKYQNVNRGAL